MQKTLLLVFIHGFKGSDSTFAGFPSHLAALLRNALPRLKIETIVYPSFETRGELRATVGRFQEWLSNKVIDLEVALGTPSPTVDPGVRIILVGHSMGGIVAAEALRSISGEKPIPWHAGNEESADDASDAEVAGGTEKQDGAAGAEAKVGAGSELMFPYIQGLLAFDTPYLGLSPGVVAHGAEGHWKTGKALYDTAAGLFATSAAASAAAASQKEGAPRALPESSSTKSSPSGTDHDRRASKTENTTAAAAPAAPAASGWGKWGKIAMIAGAASAVAAVGGTAAYMKRDQINEAFSWVGSHLQFVGCLGRGEELKQRLAAVAELQRRRNIGFANLYTCLGKNASSDSSIASHALGADRTFCVVPKSDLKAYFYKTVNDKATEEAWAHMWMFAPTSNPGYYDMGDHARDLIMEWVSKGWYESSSAD